MPGPGGGSRGGGGFGGGGFHGGGFSGGGFHGGGFHHHYYHRPFWGWGYRRPYYGGGCLGGLMSIFLAPIILVMMAAMLLFGFVGSSFVSITDDGVIAYDEEDFQDYADAQYAKEFAGTAYEDNILLVVLTDEGNSNYCYIAWVGDHIDTDINYMFGADGTQLGSAMNASINTSNYKYSLDSNLAQVVTQMQKHINQLGLESAFICQEEHDYKSHLTNYSDLNMNADTVNLALENFTQTTGIPMVVVVEEMDDVFDEVSFSSSPATTVISVVLVVLAVVLIVKGIKNRKKRSDDENYDRPRDYDNY